MKIIENNNITYYVGKNSSENDELYKSMPNDSIWFHLDQSPSSHVYAVGNLTRPDLKYGAKLVRENSKGQGPVIYTFKKYIKLIGNGQVELLQDPK